MARKTLEQFTKEAQIVHNSFYLYPVGITIYVNMHTKIKIVCPKHGIFIQIPTSHLYSQGNCPQCIKLRRHKSPGEIKKYRHEYAKKYYQMNPAKRQYDVNIWKKKNPKRAKEIVKRHRLKHYYGITIEDYNKMFDEQKGCCAICENKQIELNRELAVDHDHITGKVRGLLCNPCNRALGIFKDNQQLLDKAIQYLNRTI